MSDSLRLHGLYSPWNSLGQNTGEGSLSLLQGKFRGLGSGICLFSHPSPNTILMICRFGIHTSAGGFLASGRKGQGAKDSDSTKSSQRSLVGRWRACGTMIFAVMFSLATLIKYRSYSRSRWALGSQGSGCDGQHLHRVLHCCKQSTGYA